MTPTPEQAILGALAQAAETMAMRLDEALCHLGDPPDTVAALEALDPIQRLAATALIKRVEQMQDILARMFRTALIADGVDISVMTARDVANRMEKLGALGDARAWSDIVRLRNRLAHEYPVAPAEQLDRLASAVAAVSVLQVCHADLLEFLRRQSLLD